MLLKTVICSSCLAAALSLCAQEPFDLSIACPAGDMSPYYRAVVRHATDRHRGDGNGTMAIGHIETFMSFADGGALELQEVTTWLRARDIYLFSRLPTGVRLLLSEAHFDPDPFPAEFLTLRNIEQIATHASNQTMSQSLPH